MSKGRNKTYTRFICMGTETKEDGFRSIWLFN